MECVIKGCKYPAEHLEEPDGVRYVLLCAAHYAAWRTSRHRALIPEFAPQQPSPTHSAMLVFWRWQEIEEWHELNDRLDEVRPPVDSPERP